MNSVQLLALFALLVCLAGPWLFKQLQAGKRNGTASLLDSAEQPVDVDVDPRDELHAAWKYYADNGDADVALSIVKTLEMASAKPILPAAPAPSTRRR